MNWCLIKHRWERLVTVTTRYTSTSTFHCLRCNKMKVQRTINRSPSVPTEDGKPLIY